MHCLFLSLRFAGQVKLISSPGALTSKARKWIRIAELERKIGQQALEIDFLKGCLQRIEEQRMLQALTGNPPSTGRSKKK
jgi:hypothetical protein